MLPARRVRVVEGGGEDVVRGQVLNLLPVREQISLRFLGPRWWDVFG